MWAEASQDSHSCARLGRGCSVGLVWLLLCLPWGCLVGGMMGAVASRHQ